MKVKGLRGRKLKKEFVMTIINIGHGVCHAFSMVVNGGR